MTLCLTDDYIIEHSPLPLLNRTMPRSSKRKRVSHVQDDVLDEDDAPGVSVPLEDDEGTELDIIKPEQQEESVETNRRLEVEAELWDSFREEFHEGTRRFSSVTYD